MDKKQQERLVKACKSGNRKAQFELYEQFKIPLFGVCMRYARNKSEAEDMLQEAFFRIFKDLKQFKGDASLVGWMRRVCVNSSLMHIRKFRKIQFSELSENHETNPLLHDTQLLTKNRSDAVIKMIRSLPDNQQMVFNLRVMDGYSFKEISDKLEINEATLRSHFLRARKALQSLLNRELNSDGR